MSKLKRTLHKRRAQAVQAVFVVLFITAGLVALRLGGAASYATSSEAETGTVAGGASVVANAAGASGNSAVRFGNGLPPRNPADVIMYDGFEDGNFSKWYYEACPNGITFVNSPVRNGKAAAKFTVHDSDTNAKCPRSPTNNPRAQLLANPDLEYGGEYYLGHSVYFPTGFPKLRGYFQVAQVHGPPYGGAPIIGTFMCGNTLCFSRNMPVYEDYIWKAPTEVKLNVWHDFVYRIKLSTDPKVGFAEIWYNGVKQKFKTGQDRVYFTTLRSGGNYEPGSSNSFYVNQYRQRDQNLGTITIYQDEAAIGKTYEAVAPR